MYSSCKPSAKDAGRLGRVAWWSGKRGYGFITVLGLGDVFVHYSAIMVKEGGRRDLIRDQRVRLHVVEGPKGLLASDVTVST